MYPFEPWHAVVAFVHVVSSLDPRTPFEPWFFVFASGLIIWDNSAHEIFVGTIRSEVACELMLKWKN